MTITQATAADAEAILALQHLAYQTEAAIYGDPTLPPLLDTFDGFVARFEDRRFLKAVEQGRIVGSVRGWQKGDTCFVERLIVHPDYRRRGIGSALLRKIETFFPDVRRFELFTGHRSEANIRLYERLGYRAFRQQPANEKVTLVFLEKPARRTIRSERLELIAATKDLLEVDRDLRMLASALQAEVPDNWPMPLYDDGARQFFLGIVTEHPEAVGWTAWYILLPNASGRATLIGSIGACGMPDSQGKIIVGYSLLDQFHGRGYATEALRGFIDWAKQDDRLRKVVADTFPNLPASIRVLEKNGFVRCGNGDEEGSLRFECPLR
jgi:RimJ/RimL family protein N-acetyltransferase